LALLCAVPVSSKQKPSSVRGDDSDWWSTVAEFTGADLSAHQTNTQNRELLDSVLEIATIKLGFGEIAQAQAKLGQATVVSRGDAATARAQVCYVASDSDTHLVFEEEGEGFGTSFYLFKDGPNWNGSELCSKLPLISQPIQTANGLRLGLTRNQVEAILGKPSTASPQRLTYVLEVKKMTPASDLEKLRRQHTDLSDEEFHESFDFYYLDFFVVAKFNASKLSYLAVTKSTTFP